MVALGFVAVKEYAAMFAGKLKYIGHVFSMALIVIVVGLFGYSRREVILHSSGDPRAASYLALADWLNTNTNPSESVAYVEIGYLGYYTENRVIDLLGLVTPGITSYIAQGDIAQGFWMYDPDYFIYLPDFDWALAGIHNDFRFEQNYKLVH